VTKINDQNITVFNGIELCDVSLDTLIENIKSTSQSHASYIVTPNADHFSRLGDARHNTFSEAYSNADIKICDSRIIQKLSFLEKKQITHVIPGSDLTKKIIEDRWYSNKSLLSIGPTKNDADIIRKKYKLSNYQNYTPPMGFIKDEKEVIKCVEFAVNSKAEFIFIAVGSPQQELLANTIKKAVEGKKTSITMMLCVGASLDFLSGRTKRAPFLAQKFHLEWLHRALSDPKRLLPRYYSNFLWIIKYVTLKLLRKP
jgi:exopolysaccharide biosynthesis WecB/TagA/CpsF family protein